MPEVSDPQAPRSARDVITEMVIVLVAVFPLSTFTIYSGWRLERRWEFSPRLRYSALSTSAAAGLGILLLVGLNNYFQAWVQFIQSCIDLRWNGLGSALAILGIVGLPLGIAFGMAARHLYDWMQGRHPLHGPGHLGQKRRRTIEARALLVASEIPIPLVLDGMPVLGPHLDSDDDAEGRVGDWVVIPRSAHHLIALGATGSGKTTLIKRLCEAHLAMGWSVICIDGKEDPEAAHALVAAAHRQAVDSNRIRIWPESGPIDLFRGGVQETSDLVHALSDWTEPYYEQAARVILRLCLDDPRGLPRTLGELIERVDVTSLKTTWAGTERAELASKLTPELVTGVRMRYWALNTALETIGAVPKLALHNAWSFSDADAIWVTLPTSTTPVVAAGFGRAVMLDLISYIRSPARRTDQRPILLIVEELGALVGRDPTMGSTLVETLERARSAGVRVILSGQTPESLGDPAMQARLLRSGSAVICMRSPSPESVLDLLGTRVRPESSLGIGIDGIHLPQGSTRLQDQYAVSPDEIRTLPVGRAIFIHQGRFTMFQVPPAAS